jgi:hypothetical protein
MERLVISKPPLIRQIIKVRRDIVIANRRPIFLDYPDAIPDPEQPPGENTADGSVLLPPFVDHDKGQRHEQATGREELQKNFEHRSPPKPSYARQVFCSNGAEVLFSKGKRLSYFSRALVLTGLQYRIDVGGFIR